MQYTLPLRPPSLVGKEDALASLAFADEPQQSVIRDSIWGDIALGSKGLDLVDTSAFQRLRRVQQLGFTSWAFPGGSHSRFEHSLGVYHLTRLALLELLRQPQCPPLSREDVDTALATALLHDIGHYPFSHAVEELEHRFIRPHEEIGREIVVGPEVSEVLEERWGVDPARVARLMRKGPVTDADAGIDGLIRDLVTGSVDTDKLDYLVRDARQCNVPYGMIDVERLIKSLRVWPAQDSGDPRLVLDEKGIGSLQSLIFAKYLMFYNVYWQHTSRVATVMFLRALQEALEAGTIAPEELERSDDASVVALLSARSDPSSNSAILVGRVVNRRLYKRALLFSQQDPWFERLVGLKADPERRRQVEVRWSAYLSSRLGRPLGDCAVLIDIPEAKSFSVTIGVVSELVPEGQENPLPWSEVSGLSDADMARYHGHIRKVMVVASEADLAAAVRVHADALLEMLTA